MTTLNYKRFKKTDLLHLSSLLVRRKRACDSRLGRSKNELNERVRLRFSSNFLVNDKRLNDLMLIEHSSLASAGVIPMKTIEN